MQKERFPRLFQSSDVAPFRVEAQSVTPSEFTRVLEVAHSVHGDLIERYGQFFHPKSIRNNEDLPERLVVSSDAASIGFALDGPFHKSMTGVVTLIAGLADTDNGIVYVTDVDVLRGDLKVMGMDIFDSEILSKMAAKHQAMIIAHEMVHQYQDRNLPLLFQEMSAYYIQEEYGLQDSEMQVSSEPQGILAGATNNLINLYGEDVHALSFGTLTNYQRKRQILRSLPQSFSSIEDFDFVLSFLK